MKFYLSIALGIGGLLLLTALYRFAYLQGFQTCQFESTKQALKVSLQNTRALNEARNRLNQYQIQLEMKKENDKTCADILRFDVRPCL